MSTLVSSYASRCLMAALGLLLLASSRLLAVPAFPGAEGFGANATGGRGGSVYVVTNLNDSGPGSFRDAVSQPNRYVVFAVGGVIRISSRVAVKNNLTIAGQTAPGEGVTIHGNGLSFSGASNTITRYLRVRMGVGGDSGKDAIGVANGHDMIFDHVTVSWGRDETFSISGDDPANPPSNITLQDCLIAMGLQTHSAGGLIQTDGGVSIIRCLYIDNHTRNPKVKGVNEFINCVVYNWGGGGGYILGDSAGQSYANIVHNYFISGPNTTIAPFTRGNLNFHVYAAENYHDANRNGSLDGSLIPSSGYTTVDFQPARYPYPTVARLLSPAEAYAHVAASAGASKVRDRVDLRYIAELTSLGTLGQIPNNENDAPINGAGPVAGGTAPVDSDGDGMPDAWERATGTDPAVADANGDSNADGYTNLEEYLNGLVPAAVQGVAITGISDDTGNASNDGVTSDGALVLRGTAEPGSTVTVTRVGTGVLGTAVATSAGTWSLDYSATVLPEGSYAFTAAAVTPSGWSTPPTAAFLVRVDRTAPAAARITSVRLDAGALVFSGAAEPQGTVLVSRVGGGVVATALANDDGVWTAPHDGGAPAPAVHEFTVAVSDAAGNPGPVSDVFRVNTAQPPPVIGGISADTGVSASDLVTSDGTLVLSGTGPAGATLSIERIGTGVIGTAVAGGDGAWSFDYSATVLPAGTHIFSAAAESGGTFSPASAPATVVVDTTAPTASSILRLDPQLSAVVVSSVTYRVTFAEPVAGVGPSAFQLAVTGTATGSVSGVAPVDPATYDVAVTGISGEGTLRLDLKAAAPGVTDIAGNALTAGYTAGQIYTLRAPGSGVWITPESGEPWSDAFNWEGGLAAGGPSATADFGTLDIDAPTTVLLDAPRTVGHLVFSDADTSSAAGWTLSDGGTPANVLTLAVNTGTPSLTVGALGAGATASLEVALVSDAGLEKRGAGIAVLNKAATTGAVAVNQGTLRVGAGGTLSVPGGTIGSSLGGGSKLEVATGGAFSASGLVQVVRPSGGAGVLVSGGAAVFDGGIGFANARDGRVQITAGTLTASSIDFPRSNDNSQAYTNGMLVQGGEATVGVLNLGSADSYATLSVEGGRLNVTGPLSVGWQKAGGARGGLLRVTGGTLVSTDAAEGLTLARRTPGDAGTSNGVATFSGGTSLVQRIRLGSPDTTGGTARLDLAGGAVYVGAGGISGGGAGGFSVAINLNGGVLGAQADWASSLPMKLGGSVTLRAADPEGAPHDLLLSGVLSGPGGFTKAGAGTLVLTGTNAFTGSVTIAEGSLSGSGALAAPVVLSGGSLAAAGTAPYILASSVTFNGGSALVFGLGESGVSGRLAMGGAFSKGTPGSYTVRFRPGSALAAGATYTLATFGSTDFAASDFTVAGLPDGWGAVLQVTGTSLQATMVMRPVITSASTASGTHGAPFQYSITADNGPVLFSASGLPGGLSVDPSTGLISGTPQAAGSFLVTIGAANAAGNATAPLALTIGKAAASVTLGSLRQAYDGTPRPATASASPGGLAVVFTYDGKAAVPVYPGRYAVVAAVQDPNHDGTASGTLEITTALLVRHAPGLSGDVEGSAQLALPESVSLNSNAGISGDLLVSGSPAVQLNGQVSFGGTIDASGAATPSNYTITLNSGSVLRQVVRRVDPVAFPAVAAPRSPTGTRDVMVNQPGQDLGDPSTLRNLTLNRGAGPVALPPGVYGTVSLNADTVLVVGQGDAVQPAVYEFARVTLNSGASIQVLGPVVLRLGEDLQINGGSVGAAEHPAWLRIELARAGVSLNSGSTLYGEVLAPGGAVIVNRRAAVHGRVTADRCTVNSGGLLDEAIP